MAAKRYADDYETVITTDEKGNEKKRAVYRGEYFSLSVNEEGLSQFKRIALWLIIGIVVFHVGSGFVNNQGMNQFYVGLPYVSAFFPMVYLVMSLFRLPKDKPQYRRDEIGLSIGRMKTSSYILLVFLLLSVLGEVVYFLFVSAGEQTWLEILYLMLATVTAVAVYWLVTLIRKIQILPIAHSNKNPVP